MSMINSTMKKIVPEYGYIKKAMPQVNAGRQRENKTPGNKKPRLLTERSQNEGKPVLRKGVSVNQAAKKINGSHSADCGPAGKRERT